MRFEEYVKQSDAMSFETMTEIYNEILDNATCADEDFRGCWKKVIETAIDYTNVRAKWSITRALEEDRRSAKHDAFINEMILLERIFKLNNWKSEKWAKLLFNSEPASEMRVLADVQPYRRRVGDFGNYIVFVQALETRKM